MEASSSSETLQVGEQPVATAGSDKETRIGLVARADSRLVEESVSRRRALSGVSHETIYRSLYVQARGVLKKELLRHLRSKRTMRRPRRTGDKRGQIADLVSISQRPATVEDRAVPGHWEGDLLSRVEEQLHRDVGRTAYALRDVGEGSQQGYPNRRLRADQAGEDDTERAV